MLELHDHHDVFRPLQVGSSLDLADDIVTLAKEGQPVIKNLFLLVIEILPVGPAIFRFER